MANPTKAEFLSALRDRFGELTPLPGSRSLFSIADDTARVYIRYSKVHASAKTFFGLRQVDLALLEGHNSFICLLLDDDSEPVLIPFVEYEELFQTATPARDGQFKVQLLRNRDSVELYVARMGRFNVEAHVGLSGIQRVVGERSTLDSTTLSHGQAQSLLAGIGRSKGYEVYVPPYDIATIDRSFTGRLDFRREIPTGYSDVAHIVSEIDVLWIASGTNEILGLFEVEHSTPVYSGLLRFNDAFLSDPRLTRFVIVSNDRRRARFSKQAFRPTFRRSGLTDLVSFLDYANLVQWHSRIAREGIK